MTNENKNTNSVQVIEKKYIITDAITAGFLVDGLSALQLYAIPYIAPTLLPLPVLAPPVIIGMTTLYSTAASIAYYVRADALENEHGIFAYIESGITKYGFRQLTKSIINIGSKFYNGQTLDISQAFTEILYESAKGAINNGAYGLGNQNISKSNSTTLSHIASPFYIEPTESAIDGYIKNTNIASEINAGLVAGLLTDFNANVIYANSIGPIHSIVDYFYQDTVGQTSSQEL